MPIVITKPVVPPSVTSVELTQVVFDMVNGAVIFFYDTTDSSGVTVSGRVSMPPAAYQNALVAASGSLRARNFAVFQQLLPAFAGPAT